MSPLDNQPGTASATTRGVHCDLKMALGPDRERINSGRHHRGAIGRGDTVDMWPNPFIYWLQVFGILLLIPAGYEAPNLPDASSLVQLPSQPGFSAASA
ncbi:hypothetical protein MTO96_032137 [Rhipicephalus appendiculatus]